MNIAQYSVVCRLSTLGLLAALLAGPALSHAMVHSLHLPITCHRSLKSHLFPPAPLVDDRSFVGPSDLVPSTARALVLGLTTLLLLFFSLSLSLILHCVDHRNRKYNIGKPVPQLVELIGRERSSRLQNAFDANDTKCHTIDGA